MHIGYLLFVHRTTGRNIPLAALHGQIFVNWVLIGGVGGYFLYRSTYDLAGLFRDELGNLPYMITASWVVAALLLEIFVFYTHLLFAEIVEKKAQEYEDNGIHVEDDEKPMKALLINSQAKEEMLETYHFDLARVDVAWTLITLAFIGFLAVTATPVDVKKVSIYDI